MNPRIEQYLCDRLAGAKGWTAYAPVSQDEIDRMVAALAKPPKEIDLLVDLGLLSAGDAETWRARWATRRGRYQPPPGASEQAAAYLAKIDETDQLRRLAAQITYEQLGILDEPVADDDEEYEWEPDDLVGIDDTEASVPKRVIRGPAGQQDGVVLAAIEIHDGLADVQWDFDPDGGASARTMLRLFHREYVEHDDEDLISLSDDIGTEYAFRGGASGARRCDIAGARSSSRRRRRRRARSPCGSATGRSRYRSREFAVRSHRRRAGRLVGRVCRRPNAGLLFVDGHLDCYDGATSQTGAA